MIQFINQTVELANTIIIKAPIEQMNMYIQKSSACYSSNSRFVNFARANEGASWIKADISVPKTNIIIAHGPVPK